MYESLMSIGACLLGVGIFFLGKVLKTRQFNILKKQFEARDFMLKALSVLLFFLFMPYLFQKESIAYQIGLNYDAVRAAEPRTTYLFLGFAPVSMVFLTILKWLTLLMIAVTILLPFFKKREAHDFTIFISPIIFLFNCIFFKPIAQTIVYSPSGFAADNWRIIHFACLMAFTGAISIERLVRFIAEKDFANIGRRLLNLLVFVLFYLMAYMPVYAPQLFFGMAGGKPKGFTLTHRMLIYLTYIFPFAIYFFFRNKEYEERRYLLVMLAFSGFVEYFAQYLFPGKTLIGALPLHLCNTAIMMMFFAYIFNLKGVFYFTYLVNIMGATIAMFMPTTTDYFFDMASIRFFYNHIYAVALPILGVALKLFERPNLKLMGKAIGFFTIYVVFAAVMDGWLNNSASLNPGTYGQVGHVDIDYFFLYSNFIVDKVSFAKSIKNNFVWTFQLGDTKMTFYYLYILGIYLGSIIGMFGFWGLYGIFYKVEDQHIELARRKKLMRVDKVNLLKELDGRPVTEPLHPEGEHMIKISHFSKTYSGSDRKAVDDLNLEIHEGEVFGFIGHNGAGKSTTIKSLVGIQTISEGNIEICGYDIARQPLEAKLNIGYVSDNHAVYEKLTGREYIGYVADLYMVKEEDKNARIEKYGNLFGLMDALDREIKSYSHGMKQKLMVISALIHNPKVWVLDEPLTGLDPTSSYQIKECMRMHADEGNIVFFSSHVIEVVEKICDRVAIISGGKLRRVCTPDELREEGHSLEELYLKYATLSEEEQKEESQDSAEAEEQATALEQAPQEQHKETEESNEAKQEDAVEQEEQDA